MSTLPAVNRPSLAARVERGIYAQGWYAESHCYHPSLPPRRLRMVEQFSDYRGTMLTWPALGGGGISLPYLEEEVDAPVPARYRFYGYVNDRDFIAACAARDIKAFSVIFCMQGWEFPAELNEAEDEVLALNELRGVGTPGWLGLREFTQDTYPKLWKSFASYFPEGLRDFRGEPVTDLWEECCSRDIHGRPHRGHWLECGDRDHICHYMDLNNPVWLEYLKAVIRVQIDAGVAGIQFDEPSSPISALQYGGCFCDVCMAGFTDYLIDQPADLVPGWVHDELPDFHYGRWLLAHGKTRISAHERDFLTDAYAQYLRGTAAASFLVLTSYAREYAASTGREVLLSANLYDGLPVFDPHVAMLDVAVPEQRTTLYKQPGWMRYMAGFASGKPLVVNVNPYGGVLPELAQDLKAGRSHDRVRTMMYEAAALGVNMAVPYGAWMGSIIEDALYLSLELVTEIQDFLADHEVLFGGESLADTAVVYSVDSNFLEVSFRDMTVDDRDTATHGRASGRDIGFFRCADTLAAAHQPFDAVIFHDGVLREDDASAADLARYRRVVLPDCTRLTDRQLDALRDYAGSGGEVFVVGDIGGGTVGRDMAWLTTAPTVHRIALGDTADRVARSAVGVNIAADLAVNLQTTNAGHAVLHVVNYTYDADTDRTTVFTDVTVEVDLPYAPSSASVLVPEHEPHVVAVAVIDQRYQVTIPELHQYAIVEFLP